MEKTRGEDPGTLECRVENESKVMMDQTGKGEIQISRTEWAGKEWEKLGEWKHLRGKKTRNGMQTYTNKQVIRYNQLYSPHKEICHRLSGVHIYYMYFIDTILLIVPVGRFVQDSKLQACIPKTYKKGYWTWATFRGIGNLWRWFRCRTQYLLQKSVCLKGPPTHWTQLNWTGIIN